MKRLLLVDDDAVVLRSYRDRLSAHGFQVNTAPDGGAAINLLRSAKPDLVVLDLMMPNVSGVEVLKFIRGETRLAATPVVVLTDTFTNPLGREAAAIGIERALLKHQCSPSVLMSVIDELLEAKPLPQESLDSGMDDAGFATEAEPFEPAGSFDQSTESEEPVGESGAQMDATSAGQELMTQGPALCAELRRIFQIASRQPAMDAGWEDFYSTLHSLAELAAEAQYGQIAQMASVFEALLYVLLHQPENFNPSVLRTIANLLDFLELQFQYLANTRPAPMRPGRALVVDDDAVSNRMIAAALGQTQIEAHTTEEPLKAWEMVLKEHYDLLLLDVEMPQLDGFDFCKRVRALPGYGKTPVIFVTAHSDFTTRARSTLSGGDDLIAKPILPMELAAKAIMHMLKRQMTS